MILVHGQNIETQSWQVSGSNLVLPDICRYSSVFFSIDPTMINSLGGTKTSTFTQSQLDANFKFSTVDDISVVASDYADSNWSAKGWTTGVNATFLLELQLFIQNNYGQQSINPNLNDMNIVLTRGLINGIAYSIPFVFVGDAGYAFPTIVDLSSHFNRVGITTDGTMFATGIGLDGRTVYSSSFIGDSIVFNGTPFYYGPVNAESAISTDGSVIPLENDNYGSLHMLAIAVNGAQADQLFTVTYTDSSRDNFQPNLSDWAFPQSYSGEQTVTGPMSYRNQPDGSTQAGHFYMYEYTFNLDSSKQVQSITLPNNSNVDIFAITLMP